jgi:hypothetical protein
MLDLATIYRVIVSAFAVALVLWGLRLFGYMGEEINKKVD